MRHPKNPLFLWPVIWLCLVPFATPTSAQDSESDVTGMQDKPARWWKGNLHTHSLWSDGDEFPEMIADWYLRNGYHFLALTDHNVLSEGQRWMKVDTAVKRSDSGILTRYRQRFGPSWVQTRGEANTPNHEVRLKPLDEFRHLLEQRDRFLMIPAEEISDRAENKPVHINATNLAEVIEPVGGETVREALQNNLRAIMEHAEIHGREVFPHVNHPNFGYAIDADDLAAVVAERFFEVYNGHPGVNQLGDEDHPSIERMWDLINAIRATDLEAPLMMGIATDDSHEYHGKPGARPGRGWVMVRSRHLTPEYLIRALKRGDFYASSGVELSDIQWDSQRQTLRLQIQGQPGATYQTQFIATIRQPCHYLLDAEQIGAVVATSDSLSPEYTLLGDELYVRAVVTSSLPAVDPSYANQFRQAWTQPVSPR